MSKKFLLVFLVIVSFVGFVLYSRKGTLPTNTPQVIVPQTPNTQNPTPTQYPPNTLPTPTTGPASTPTPTPVSSGYKDGSYTGSVADAYYGLVQVKAVIQGGRITDVQFLQSPGDRETSIYINSQAMPILKSEAIQAQSANVDIVSGATATSGAFQQSLSSALSQAKA